MDNIDLQILRLLQEDNRCSAAELGQKSGLSISAANDRVRRLNASGVIRANRAIVNPNAVGLHLCAFIFVDLEPRANESSFAKALSKLPGVLEAYHVTGPHSWLLKALVCDSSALQLLIAKQLKSLPGVLRTETFIALDTAKETTALPLGGMGAVFSKGKGVP
jgi:Lrp/AsnC family leucine-responsive transcriptional regulator